MIEKSYYAERKYLKNKYFKHYIKALYWWIKWKYYEVRNCDYK